MKGRWGRTNLEEGRAGDDVLVAEVGAGARQDDIGLARDAGGDHVDAVVGAGALDPDGDLWAV